MLRKRALSAALLVLMLSTCPVTQAQDPAAAATQAMAAASAASAAASAAQQSASAAAKAAQAAASSASASGSSTWIAPASFVVYSIPFIVLFGSLIAILVIRSSLLPKSWSLADALSEEVPLPIVKKGVAKDDAGKEITTEEFVYDKDGKPVLAPVLKASSSRVIALMGMLAILFMFIGFGTFALYGFGKTGKMPESVDDLVKFLAAGMTLFAPYVVNKFASLFQGLTGSK